MLEILFEHEEESYYKPQIVFGVTILLIIKSKDDRKTLLVKKHLNKCRPYLKDIKNSLKKSDMEKIK